ncbi:MAG: hypothetical protein PVI90_18240 [Desulfobacteraceae bacterium]|jgi:hypothetical protein
MIKYYNNREISKKLNVNLARWKRWSREFLPPDPLGGLQSGYARQYSLREAFLVALGGHLVGFLKFSVPQAKIILSDLGPWMEHAGYFQWGPHNFRQKEKTSKNFDDQYVLIRSRTDWNKIDKGYCYAVSPDRQTKGFALTTTDEFTFINTPVKMRSTFGDSPFLMLLCIGQFRKYFLQCL